MSRWIDADAFKQELKENYVFYGFSYLLNDFYVAIDDAPSIDLVFCEECKRRYRSGYRGDEYWVCDFMDAKIKDDDFCSYGERKESE